VALDRGLVGRSYPPSPVYEVGRVKIAEFAAAVGDDDPLYRDPEAARAAGHPDVVAPPTFAMVVTLGAADVVLDDPEVGIDFSRVVHGEQRFTHHRPIRAGDRLVATTSIENVRSAAGNDLLTTRVDVATEDGEPVCSAMSILVARGTA
jgi:acyl dehydratase